MFKNLFFTGEETKIMRTDIREDDVKSIFKNWTLQLEIPKKEEKSTTRKEIYSNR